MIGVDTNILVYAFDASATNKRPPCKQLIRDIAQGNRHGVVTTQILAEFYHVVTSKVAQPISSAKARALLTAITESDNWTVVTYTEEDVLAATAQSGPFWDALIEQALLRAGVDELVTENGDDFTRIDTTNVLQ